MSSSLGLPNEILSMTETIDPLRVDGYEFSEAKLSARERGAFSCEATADDDVDESEVGESFELRRLRNIMDFNDETKNIQSLFLTVQ